MFLPQVGTPGFRDGEVDAEVHPVATELAVARQLWINVFGEVTTGNGEGLSCVQMVSLPICQMTKPASLRLIHLKPRCLKAGTK